MSRLNGLLALTSIFLLTTAVAGVPPALEGPVFLPGDLTHGASAGDQEEVAIAAGGSGYLVAWTDMRTSNPMYDGFGDGQTGNDVYAARLDAAGNLLDAQPIIVTQAFGAQQDPRVGWNGQNWLVVWRGQTQVQGWTENHVWAARIAPDGTLLDPNPILLMASEVSEWTIAVTSNGTDWLVTGQQSDPFDLVGVRVLPDGTALAPTVLVVGEYSSLAPVTATSAQGQYLITYDGWGSPAQAQRFASDLRRIGGPLNMPSTLYWVASNGTDYFVVWDPPGSTLYGSRMSIDGTLLDPAGIPLMPSLYNPSIQTDVSWDGSNWWVVHELISEDGAGLHYARVAPDGTLLDPQPVHVFNTTPADFVGPWKFTAGLTGGVEIAWADQDCGCADEWSTAVRPWDIRGQHVTAEGQILSVGELSCSAPAQSDPDLAAGDGQFLSVYVSELNDVRRIVAQRLDTYGEAIDTEPIELATGTYVEHPAASWNGSHYMIVWDEYYYCVGGDPGPCGNFIQSVRMLPDGTILDPQPVTIMAANHADVEALGNDFLVVGRNFVENISHWVIPLATRVDGTTGALLDPEPLRLGWLFAVQPKVTTFMDQWLVVWEQRASHDENWGGTRYNFVKPDGRLKFEPLQAGYACGGATPDVAASGAAALVVCREGAPGHFLNAIHGGIILPDETSGGGFVISDAVEEQRGPAVTWTGTEFLVVWEDQRNSVEYWDDRTDLYGARVSEQGTLLDPAGFPVMTGQAPEQQPTLATREMDTLLGVSVFRDDPAYTNYRNATFHTPATPNDPPVVSFSGAPTTGCGPLYVSYADETLDPVTSWNWSFGDGTSSTAQNPAHVYQDPGTYTVFMTADGGEGSGAGVRFDYVTVEQPTVAGFWGTPASGCGPVTVQFTDGSLGEPTSWLWTFGDDTFSTAPNPSHTYLYPGSHTVTLTVNGACGGDTMTRVGFVDVPELCPNEHVALEELSVASNPVGTYQDTHPDSNSSESLFEVQQDSDWILDHRWRFDVGTSAEDLRLRITMYTSATNPNDYSYEYSTDNVDYTPLVTVTVPHWSTTVTQLPASLQGSVWVRVRDSNPAAGGSISVGSLAFERAGAVPDHPVEAIMGLEVDRDRLEWIPASSATVYDVMMGDLASLQANGSIGDAWCALDNVTGTDAAESSVPPPGTGYYYVVRGDADQRTAGTFDNPPGLSMPDEQRDQEVGTLGGGSCNDMP